MTQLARIYAAAAHDEIDEPARRAYADSLGDDPRARFIRLQLDRVRDGTRLEAIERELLLANWRAWVGAPAAVVPSFAVEFARGFWDGCMYFDQHPDYARFADAPEWSTVRRLQLNAFIPLDQIRALVGGRVHRSLRMIRVHDPAALRMLAAWDGPFLAVRELQLFVENFEDVPAEFGGLAELLRLHVHLQVGLAHESIAALEKLADGPGTHSHLSELALTMFGRHQRSSLPVSTLLDRAKRCRAKALRSIELGPEGPLHLHLERDDAGAWTRLRLVLIPPYGNHPPSTADLGYLLRFLTEVPAGYDLVVQLPDMPLDVDDLQRELERMRGRLERVPLAPFPPAAISAVGAR